MLEPPKSLPRSLLTLKIAVSRFAEMENCQHSTGPTPEYKGHTASSSHKNLGTRM
jgi:hypothetical protein